MVLDVVDDWFCSGDKTAQRGKRLAKGPHDQVHVIVHAQVGGRTLASAEHTDGVGIIHHQPCLVLFAQGNDVRQGSDVAAHAEHTIHND